MRDRADAAPPHPERGAERGKPRAPRGELPTAEATRGLALRRLSLAPADVVFLKGLVEASEGLASLFASPTPLSADGARRGDRAEVVLAAPPGRDAELDRFIADVTREIGAEVRP